MVVQFVSMTNCVIDGLFQMDIILDLEIQISK